MLSHRMLRRTGADVTSRGQKLLLRHGGVRHLSINMTSAPPPRSTRMPRQFRGTFTQQSRSLSLFGWGSSSKTTAETSPASSANDVDIGPSTTGLDNIRTIKATHGTSDAPELHSTGSHPPNNLEPQFVEDLQEKITLPHGSTADKVSGIMSGETDITAASERMGYLKDVCGLDFGWGPTAVMENVLEWLHIYGGLSWSTSIIAMAVLLRVVLVKPLIGAQLEGKKMREIQPFMKPLRERQAALLREGDRVRAAQVGQEIKELNKSADVKWSRAFVPLLIQFPFSYGAFRVLRNAGQLPVPAFVTESWLWTHDLSFSDPYFITPAISAATIYLSFRQQAKSNSTMLGPQMMQVMGTLMPAASFLFMLWQPGSVQLYFMTTGLCAYATTSILRQQWFRNSVGLGPLESSTTPGSAATVSRPLPSNMKLMQPRRPVEPETAPIENKVDENRSVVDRVVDSAKDRVKEVKKSFSSLGETMTQKQQERDEQNRRQSAARYEAQRSAQLDRERQERNQQARGR